MPGQNAGSPRTGDPAEVKDYIPTLRRRMAYFDNANIDEEERRNHAFQAVCAVREGVSLARNAGQSITYDQAFDFIYEINPTAHAGIIQLLLHRNDNDLACRFKETAQLLSTPDRVVNPVDLINEEILKQQAIIKDKKDKAQHTISYINRLIAARDYFEPSEFQSENRILNHDMFLRQRADVVHQLYSHDHYQDYALDNHQVLRMRLLHPDKAEDILGVDLIYEIHDLSKMKVRFVHLQYKMWDGKELYFSSSKSLRSQLEKMDSCLCKAGHCSDASGRKSNDSFRFPFCAGFLRPTSKIQDANSKLVTSGIHVPACLANRLAQTSVKIDKPGIAQSYISHHVFEEAFNTNILGSKWIDLDDLKKFYEDKGILSYTDRIRIHAQQFDLSS